MLVTRWSGAGRPRRPNVVAFLSMLDGAGTATILYTDIVGSTQMRARLGDVEADLVRRRHDEILGAAVSKQGGSVVKGLGDGILAAFGSTAEAVNAAQRDPARDRPRQPAGARRPPHRGARRDQRG